MKRTLLIILCTATLLISSLGGKALETRPNSPYIQKGSFIRAISPIEISTADSDSGDEVFFINSSDMYIGDTNAIPKGSKLTGTIEDIREPVQGTNASIKIRIDNVITPDKRNMPVNAYLFGDKDNYSGGEITPPAYYHKIPHYTKGWNEGVLQYAPSNVRSFGQHKVIKAGSEVFIIITEDLKIF